MQQIQRITLILVILFCGLGVQAHDHIIKGRVFGNEPHDDHFHKIPLAGASVFWSETTTGTVTDANGNFQIAIACSKLPAKLVISFMGFRSDTLLIETGNETPEVVLEAARDLDEVVITGRRSGSHMSTMAPILTQVITEHELKRAACCNLSEAFETNASVDVTYSDAVSGAQQIQLLGLAGTYSQILTENTPTIRGLGQPYGLGFIPGPWMESIHISKGAGSVINGYESITGQINVELKKPESADLLYYNFYGNNSGRLESSLNTAIKINDHWTTMVLSHGEWSNNKFDHNGDSFLDHPLMRKYNIVNRYRYDKHGVMESQFGFRIMQENRKGGQKAFFDQNRSIGATDYYGFEVRTDRYEAFARTGFFLPGQSNGSIGTQLSFIHHKHDSYYGWNAYKGQQNTFYANLIYESAINGNDDHKLNAGFSYTYDDYSESLKHAQEDLDLGRRESVPGVFAQYTFHHHEKFVGILGLRTDFHNIHGTFITPRLHLRSNILPSLSLRASAGKGYRVPNQIAENTGLLVSNRQLVFVEDIRAEEAWNYGASLTQSFHLFGNDASLAVEFYRTDFVNQLIVDVDTDYGMAMFYNLNGKSYANNAQVELKFEPLRLLEITAAFRTTDVKTTINDELMRKPFVNNYKGLLSGSWSSKNNQWQIDLTALFNGSSRLPGTESLPQEVQLPKNSPAHTVMHGQITRKWKQFDVYVGGENLTNYTQKNPIIGSHNPFEADLFDASMIWGPIMGRVFYMGLRYSIS